MASSGPPEFRQVPKEEEDILDPIVMVPYVTKTGELPRKVAIERTKRYYASQNLVGLLENEGLSWQNIQLNKDNLPLYAFDNADYETRESSKWVDKVKKVPAQVIASDSNGKCIWRDCEVLDYNGDENRYLITWIDTGQSSWIPRVLLYFKAENPFIFVKRFAQAYRLRDKMESLMKYHFYVDSMPKEGIRTLGPEPEERIRSLTFNCKDLREKSMDICKYLNEVNTEYARVMNQIVLEDCIKNQNRCGMEFTVEINIDGIEKVQQPVSLFGCVDIPKYNYEEKCSEFHFWSCITRSEVISSTVRLRSECNKVLKLNLLSTHYNKSLRLEDFEQMQAQSIEQTSIQLRDSWTSMLKNIIRSSFKDIGKGWFNLQESSWDAYCASKMKRFLRMVRYMMEDSVRYLVEDTLARYCNFVERHCGSPIVDVIDIDCVNTTWPQFDHKIIKKPPLFALEIVSLEEGIFDYNTPLKNFEAVVCKAFDNAIICTQTIQQLEPSVMEKLMWSGVPNIYSVNQCEDRIVALKNRIQNTSNNNIWSLHGYLQESSCIVGSKKVPTE